MIHIAAAFPARFEAGSFVVCERAIFKGQGLPIHDEYLQPGSKTDTNPTTGATLCSGRTSRSEETEAVKAQRFAINQTNQPLGSINYVILVDIRICEENRTGSDVVR